MRVHRKSALIAGARFLREVFFALFFTEEADADGVATVTDGSHKMPKRTTHMIHLAARFACAVVVTEGLIRWVGLIGWVIRALAEIGD